MSVKRTQSVERGFGPDGHEMFLAPVHQYNKELSIPNALVVTHNDAVRQELAEALAVCVVAPFFANSIEQARYHVGERDFSFVICQDTLPDGYSGLIGVKTSAGSSVPLIIISRTGDWPEFWKRSTVQPTIFWAIPSYPESSSSSRRAVSLVPKMPAEIRV
jgi:DNA-binding NtrC family response regulator